jgi:putative N6-adenine-specific DNA methylase
MLASSVSRSVSPKKMFGLRSSATDLEAHDRPGLERDRERIQRAHEDAAVGRDGHRAAPVEVVAGVKTEAVPDLGAAAALTGEAQPAADAAQEPGGAPPAVHQADGEDVRHPVPDVRSDGERLEDRVLREVGLQERLHEHGAGGQRHLLLLDDLCLRARGAVECQRCRERGEGSDCECSHLPASFQGASYCYRQSPGARKRRGPNAAEGRVSAASSLRIVGAPETNKVMAGELSRLARRALARRPPEPRKAGTGALVYPFDLDLARLAATYHRTSSRVLWDLHESRARRLEPLYDDLLDQIAADTRGWAWDGATFSIRPRNLDAFAAGARQVVGTVKNAIIDGARARGLSLSVDPEAPDILLAVRMHENVISVSVDLGGRGMHQRGYRQRGGAAPIRENLAAVLVFLSRWEARAEPLVDPMTGSGTIAIEAALLARAAPVFTRGRRPAFSRLPAFAGGPTGDPEPLFPDTRPRILAADIDPRALENARENAAAAGVTADVELVESDFRDLRPPRAAAGVVLGNPPYGERLGDRDDAELLRLYRDLGTFCRGLRGWRAGFLCAHRGFPDAFGGRPRVVKPLKNGPQRATFYLYTS